MVDGVETRNDRINFKTRDDMVVWITQIAEKMKVLIGELHSLRGMDFRNLPKELFLRWYPSDRATLEQVEREFLISWKYLVTAGNLAEVPGVSPKPRELATPAPVVENPEAAALLRAGSVRLSQLHRGSSPADVRNFMQRVVARIHKLLTDLSHGGKPGYLSRDVYLTLFPEDKQSLYFLDIINVSWTQILELAGACRGQLECRDGKKTAGVHFRFLAESFGISLKHLILCQRVLCEMLHENPEHVIKLAAQTFGSKILAEQDIRNLLTNLASMINYLKQIE